MPGIFLALTVISGISFVLALSWAILQWARADREAERTERELAERMGRRAAQKAVPPLEPTHSEA
jgi:hypothetical protein